MNKLTHEQFNKMWEDSTKEEVLFQFYYDYYTKVEALDRIDKAIEYIENNCILSDEWTDLGFCNFVPTGNIKYKQLSPKKVKELLSILRGEDK